MVRGLKAIVAAAVATATTAAFAQTPEFNLLFASSASDGSGGVYIVNTVSNTATKVWPAAGAVQVNMAQMSPDGTKIACNSGNRLVIMGNDGSNPRTITTSVDFNGGFGGTSSFAYTSNGIFWINRNRDTNINRFLRYNLDTDQLTEYPAINSKSGSTSFAGLYSSSDGSRMWTWLTVEVGGQEYKPFINFDGGNFSAPRYEYYKFHGHNNAMRADGAAVLAIGWEFNSSINPNPHPYLWTWNLNTDAQGTTYQHGLSANIQDMGFKGLIAMANASDWVLLTPGNESTHEHFLWKYATQSPTRVNYARANFLPQHGWMGNLPPAAGASWLITESYLRLDEAANSGALHVTGWTDGGNPTVSSSKTWTGTPVITRSTSNVTITYTITNGPVLKDTAVITVRDAANVSRTARIAWTPSVSPASRLDIVTSATSSTVTLSWTNTLGAGFTFRVQEKVGTAWGAMQSATTSYIDNNPVNGTNTYRVVAISGTDTSYQEVSETFVAPSSIRITSPAANAIFTPGQQITLRWTMTNVASVQVEVAADGGETPILKTPNALTDSSFIFNLPDTVSSAVVITVRQYQSTTVMHSVTVRTTGTSVLTAARVKTGGAARAPVETFDLRGRRVVDSHQSRSAVLVQAKREASSTTEIMLKR